MNLIEFSYFIGHHQKREKVLKEMKNEKKTEERKREYQMNN